MVDIPNKIECRKRNLSGKGAAHKLRQMGMIPAIAYGPKTAPSLLSIDPRLFSLQWQKYGASCIYDVSVEGSKTFKALVKDVQREPVSNRIVHIDLFAVDMKKSIRVEIKVELIGKPLGVVEGGLLSQVLRTVEVQCLPDKVPSKLAADVSNLGIGQVLHASAIDLPEGVSLTARRDEAIATVVEPEAEEEPKVEADAELEGEEKEETTETVESDAKKEGTADEKKE